MKKIALLFLTMIIISAVSAMEQSKSITDLIFANLASSPNNLWSSSLDPNFYSIPTYAFKTNSSWGDELFFDITNPDKCLKYTLIFSGQRPRPQQHCGVFIKKEEETVVSRIFFDDNGDLDHIDTQITVKGQENIEKFETTLKNRFLIVDDQTECEETITNESENKATWSFTTKKMSFEEFIKKFQS